ncbi:MAG: RsmD family RNA methyltransferase [Actinomycetota bacterium]|nr:RsmD family RNA methyltransferase [Actinomycetota bacterium]
MRVISGSAKGTRLYGVKGLKLRPVEDSLKKSIFDSLGASVEGVRVLDLFAGTGSFGIEALSRGALFCAFIESHIPAARAIEMNLDRAHLREKALIIPAKLPGALERLKGSFSLIFIDPPFRIDTRLLEDVFSSLYQKSLLEKDGILIYRLSVHNWYEPSRAMWKLVERRERGDSSVCIFSSAEGCFKE